MDTNTDETLRQESIEYVGWGIGNVINGRIYLHKKLLNKEYDSIREKIIAHEKAHELDKKYTLKDMIHDTRHTKLDLDIIFFIITTPSSWAQFSPIIYFNKQIVIDRQSLYLYGLMAFAAVIGWKLV